MHREAATHRRPAPQWSPRTGDEPRHRAEAPQPSGAGLGPAVLRVLIVEDQPRMQLLLCKLIDELGGCEVVAVAETQAQAIAEYEALQPDALIIDLNLRQGTGLGVIIALRRGERAKRALLIVLTNHALPLLEAACRSAGADHFLDKSRDFCRVRDLLEQARTGAGGSRA